MTVAGSSEKLVDPKLAPVIARILEAHKLLVSIAHDLRSMNDFDHAQDMSDAAMFCRAAYNDLRLGKNTRESAKKRAKGANI